jgi:hypothetical protein
MSILYTVDAQWRKGKDEDEKHITIFHRLSCAITMVRSSNPLDGPARWSLTDILLCEAMTVIEGGASKGSGKSRLELRLDERR